MCQQISGSCPIANAFRPCSHARHNGSPPFQNTLFRRGGEDTPVGPFSRAPLAFHRTASPHFSARFFHLLRRASIMRLALRRPIPQNSNTDRHACLPIMTPLPTQAPPPPAPPLDHLPLEVLERITHFLDLQVDLVPVWSRLSRQCRAAVAGAKVSVVA